MILGLIGTGYGAYTGAKKSPGRAVGYALGLGFIGNLLDFALLTGVAAAVSPTVITPTTVPPLVGMGAYNPAKYRIRHVQRSR